jgi:NitT/TauT family transport system permease protein
MSKATWLRWAVVAGVVALLEVLCRIEVIPSAVMIAPSQMARALWLILRSGQMNADIAATSADVGIAVLFATIVGFLAGVALQGMPRVRRVIEPLLASYYALPVFVFYPLLIVLFGANRWPIVILGFMFAVVAMIINTMAGIDDLPRVLLKVADTFQMGSWRTALLIKLPAITPYLFAGVKLALSYAIIGVVASEFILSDSGIGYSIAFAYNDFNNNTMYALVLLIVVLVGLINMLMHLVEKHLALRQTR